MAILESPAELAARVNVSVKSIRLLIREGKLEHVYVSPGRRIALVPLGAWERFLENNMVRASQASENN